MSSSWRLAVNKFVDIVEGTTVTTKGYGLGDDLRHDANASPASPPSSRRFMLDLRAGDQLFPEEPGPYRWNKALGFGFGYQSRAAYHELQIAIGEDMEAVSRRLMDQSLWDEATTGIVAVSVGGRTALPYSIEIATQDLYLVTLSVELEHHDLA